MNIGSSLLDIGYSIALSRLKSACPQKPLFTQAGDNLEIRKEKAAISSLFLMFQISSFTLCGAATPSALSRAVARRAQRAGLPVSPAPTQYLDVGYSLLDIGYSIALSRFNCVCVSGNVLASFFPESAWSRQVPLGMFCGAGRHFPIRDIAFERLTGGVKGGRGTK